MVERIRIGTRGSELAMAQADQVIAALQGRFSGIETEKVVLRTEGDRRTDRPLADFGGRGVFVSALERALAAGEIDLAVHSAKDMPAKTESGMVIAGVLPRADARDVLVAVRGRLGRLDVRTDGDREAGGLAGEGAGGPPVIGTGSVRRKAQFNLLCPGAVCRGIRGNVPTRLQKLRNGEYDGIILAAAGLERLGLLREEDLEYRFFSCDEMVPAGGQGIIAVEGREGDRIADMVRAVSDASAYRELSAERAVMRALDAGCHEAVGVYAQHEGEFMRMRLFRGTQGGAVHLEETARCGEYLELAERLAERGKESYGEGVSGGGRARRCRTADCEGDGEVKGM